MVNFFGGFFCVRTQAWVFSACVSLISSTIAAATRELPDSDADGSSTISSSAGGAAAAGGRAGHHLRVASSGSLSSLYSTSSSSSSGMVPVRTAVLHQEQEGAEGSGSGAPGQAQLLILNCS